ncbi:MAG: O-antigen ligase family protein [Alphaproteobacteria bacterium]|nr:O-antigen ligase family protein [Alphaproteobacteria bacterium]
MPALLRRLDPAFVLPAAAAVLLPLGVLGPRMINVAASIAAILAVPWLAMARPTPGSASHLSGLAAAWRRPAVVIAALLIAWGAASALWSANPRQSVEIALVLAAIFGGGFVLLAAAARFDTPARDRTVRWFLAGGVTCLVLLAVDLSSAGMLRSVAAGHGFMTTLTFTHLNRLSSMAALLGWVAVAAVWTRHGPAWAALPAVASLAVIIVLEPTTPAVAWLAGALFFALGWRSARAAALVLLAIIVLRALAVPLFDQIAPAIKDFVIAEGLQHPLQSLGHRLEIWSFAAEMLRERPLTGWGLDASRSIPGGRELVVIFDNITNRFSEAMPLHPHSMTAEFWLELGVPGVVLGVAFVARNLLAVPAAFAGRPAHAGALAMAATALVMAESSYGIWQDWWLCTLWLGGAILFAACGPRPTGGTPP